MELKALMFFAPCLLYLVALSSVQASPAVWIPRSCLDHVREESPRDGYYQISDDNANTFTVYCDFSSEPGFAWTLVMSWALKYNDLQAFRRTPLPSNAPVNENSPNWLAYRLPHNRMQAVKVHSTHWRSTCSFPIHKVDYRDYVRGKFNDFDIMTYLGYGVCKKVEFVNIRGHVGIHGHVKFWQLDTPKEFLHIDSSTMGAGCSFNASSGSIFSEDSFGLYIWKNKNFRCTANPSATTQYWFGGYF